MRYIFPKELRLSGIPIQVIQERSARALDKRGLSDLDKATIEIANDITPPEGELETFCHEVLHHISYLNQVGLSEAQVKRMAFTLGEFLQQFVALQVRKVSSASPDGIQAEIGEP